MLTECGAKKHRKEAGGAEADALSERRNRFFLPKLTFDSSHKAFVRKNAGALLLALVCRRAVALD